MASVFLHHVVGDLTVGKPEMVEFFETETVEAAISAIGESTECGIPVWKEKPKTSIVETCEMRQQRFVGILDSLDIVAFLARSEHSEDPEKAMTTPVSKVVVHNNSLLKMVDPATRLIDALELMKQGVKRLLVPKSVVWKGTSKRFSVFFHGKWPKTPSNASGSGSPRANSNQTPSSPAAAIRDKFCCLSREDVMRFLIGCLGALAPIPLTSVRSLGAINPHVHTFEASLPAREVAQRRPADSSSIAVVETMPNGEWKIIGDISACKLWKCDYAAAAWALANFTAGQFVLGVEDNVMPRSVPALPKNLAVSDEDIKDPKSPRPKKFSSRSIGFYSVGSLSLGARSMYRGRNAPLTCKPTSSLAAVMAQMLSHRASHVWVTDDDDDNILVGWIGYIEILFAVTRSPNAIMSSVQSVEAFGN